MINLKTGYRGNLNYMIIGLAIIFGATVGLMSYPIYSNGLGLWKNVFLGVFGSVMFSFLASLAYVLNYYNEPFLIGYNRYCLVTSVSGAIFVIYFALMSKRFVLFLRLRKFLLIPQRNIYGLLVQLSMYKTDWLRSYNKFYSFENYRKFKNNKRYQHGLLVRHSFY